MILHNLRENLHDTLRLGVRFNGHLLADLTGRSTHDTVVRSFGKVRTRPGSSDAAVIRQVLRDRDYDLSRFPAHDAAVRAHYAKIIERGRIPLVVDAGANIGVSALWFASTYPDAKVVALEPDPDNAALCRHNTRERTSITVLQEAIGGSRGSVDLDHQAGEAWAVKTSRSQGAGGVGVCTLGDILELAGDECELFIVKIDIEGFEEDLFSANLEWLSEVAVLVVEPHDRLFPGRGSSHNLQVAMASGEFDLLLWGENLFYVRSSLVGPQAPSSPDVPAAASAAHQPSDPTPARRATSRLVGHGRIPRGS